MTAGRIISFLFIGVLFIGLFSGSSGCANIVPPSGGPRDSLPPVAVASLPKDSGTFVKEQKITIVFDEFVELKNANEKIIISPYPVKEPSYENKLRTVTVRLKDSLLPNTTYNINFGDAIVDLNEGNVLKDFQFSFSTGASIDSNSLSGKVILAETGETDSTMFALLYKKQEDSTVAKEKPMYVARVDAQGNFRFNNLPTGQFYVYALKEEDGNKRYSSPLEQFAFLDSVVTIDATTPAVQLYAFAAEKQKSKMQATPVDKTKGLIGAANIAAGAFDFLDTFTISFPKPVRILDVSKIKLVQDSVQTISNLTIKNDSARKQIQIINSWKPGSKYQLFLDKGYATDTSGLAVLKVDTLDFRVKAEKEYGSLRIRFTGIDTGSHPVLLFYNNKDLVGGYPFNGKEFYRKLFKPGSYKIAILYDVNNNGVWDAGDYFAKPKRQPELVQPINKDVLVKDNWDNELVIDAAAKETTRQ
ncbi:MAG: Ig-like domain-containing protein [Lacibacter sp.]